MDPTHSVILQLADTHLDFGSVSLQDHQDAASQEQRPRKLQLVGPTLQKFGVAFPVPNVVQQQDHSPVRVSGLVFTSARVQLLDVFLWKPQKTC